MAKTCSDDGFNKKTKRIYSSALLFGIYHQRASPHKFHSTGITNKDSLASHPTKMKNQETHHSTSSKQRFLEVTSARTSSSTVEISHLKKKQCFVTLQRLMVHPDGWHFKSTKASVDLDCHGMILKPGQPLMDFETIKWKLEKGLYMNTNRFAGDIRILFCNAMLCYPVSHKIHRAAVKLSELFEMKWKFLSEKCAAEKDKPKPMPLKNIRKDCGSVAYKVGMKRKSSVFKLGNEENFCPNSKRQAPSAAISSAEKVTSITKPKQQFFDAILAAQSNLFGCNYGLQKNKEREAARMMVQKLERTVFVDDSLSYFKELERLCGCSLAEDEFMTMTDLGEEKFLNRDWEEGEILYFN